MNAETTATEINLRRLERDLPRVTESERTTYLLLLEGGDTHGDAIETLRGERLMAIYGYHRVDGQN